MRKQTILTTFKNFHILPKKSRDHFFDAFEKKMLYRTTKTENPETTFQMVYEVLKKPVT